MKEPALVQRKLAILGYRAVGKTSLTNSFVSGDFVDGYEPTIETTYHKAIRFRKVHFDTDIVDTAGMVRHQSSSWRFDSLSYFFSRTNFHESLEMHR